MFSLFQQTSHLNRPLPPSPEVTAYTRAILSGVVKGLGDVVNLVIHPIDHVIYPLSVLAYDATIIFAQNGHADMHDLKNYLDRNPKMYRDAVNRMQTRINGFKQAGVAFMDASGQERTEIAAEVLTGVFVPGVMFKSARMAASKARNMREFGLETAPLLFHDTKIHKPQIETPQFECLTAEQIKATSGYEDFRYVVTEDQKLLIGRKELTKPYMKNEYLYDELHHCDLAQRQPVYVAGEMKTFNGYLIEFNNQSGGYYPYGSHLEGLMERFFTREGIETYQGGKTYTAAEINNPLRETRAIVTRAVEAPPRVAALAFVSALNTAERTKSNADTMHIRPAPQPAMGATRDKLINSEILKSMMHHEHSSATLFRETEIRTSDSSSSHAKQLFNHYRK